jgi:hypothetical protein
MYLSVGQRILHMSVHPGPTRAQAHTRLPGSPRKMLQQRISSCGPTAPCRTGARHPQALVAPSQACGQGGASAAACSTSTSLAVAHTPDSTLCSAWRPSGATRRGPSAPASSSPTTASIAAAEQHSPCVATSHQFYHLAETNDFATFSKLVMPDVKWR